MNRCIFTVLGMAFFAAPAFAQIVDDIHVSQPPTVAARYQIGTPAVGVQPRNSGDPYSNILNFTGSVIANGGAETVDGNTITRLVADDINPASIRGVVSGQEVLTIYFCVANLDQEDATARPRLRFWNDSSNAPGSYYTNSPSGAIGYTFDPLTFGPESVTCFFAIFPPGGNRNLYLTGDKFWAGMTFDDNNGTTGAEFDQMNLLGVGLFDPPTEGSSEDQMFMSDSAGSFFNVDNPSGTIGNFGGDPVANMGWAFQVPEPASIGLMSFAGLLFLRRRRSD